MEASPDGDIRLLIAPALLNKMDRALITPEDARMTVAYCEASGIKLLDQETGDFIGHRRTGALTYWVRYRRDGEGITLVSVYCHRAKIEEDAG